MRLMKIMGKEVESPSWAAVSPLWSLHGLAVAAFEAPIQIPKAEGR